MKKTVHVLILAIVLLGFSNLRAAEIPAVQTTKLVNPFEQEGNWYKTALHVHSKTSDGDVNMPVRVEQYRKAGFDVVFVTDHWKTNKIDGLSDKKFLVINGMEAHPKSNTEIPNHFVCLNLPGRFEIKQDTEAQKVIDMVKAAGGEVIYAHPYWSGHTINDILAVKGYIGIEVYNSVCEIAIGKGYNNVFWDELLNKGIILPAVATDDVHSSEHVGLAWTMIKAKELGVPEIMNALKNLCYYSSCGPVIEDFKIENGTAVIKCSPVKEIRFNGQTAMGHKVVSKDDKLLTAAEWKLPKGCRFVRAEVVDANGNHAWANPLIPEPNSGT